ncbi:MAG: hypothetical protein ACE5J2_04650 [Nitrososphaerales archaeon]
MVRSVQVLSIVGASSVVAGGWFWLTQEYWLAIALWLVGVIIIVARKRRSKKS